MVKNLINGKYFYHVVITVMLIIVVYILWNRKTKETQYELLMAAIGDAKTQGGGYADLKLANPFNPTYWQKKPVEPLWDKEGNIIDKIYDSKGTVYDNEDDVLALFKKFVSQRQLSYISFRFYEKYKKDLYTYLDSFMSNQVVGQRQLGTTNNMVQLKKIVDSLKS